MIWKDHSKLRGQHAFLSPSNYHWINYNEDDLFKRINSSYATEVGTVLHWIAERYVRNGIKMQKADKRLIKMELIEHYIPYDVVDSLDIEAMFENLQAYINDAVGYKMIPEMILYYSDNCFGTADSIIFKDGLLRIHDYKSGSVPAHMEQLMVYVALFCLEYNMKPSSFDTELRIYQNCDIVGYLPETDEIVPIMDKIVAFDKIVSKTKEHK